MEQNNFFEELIIAKTLALRAWGKIAHFYDGNFQIENKSDGSPVTQADKSANEFIIESLRKYFPSDSIVSEEAEAIVNGKRTWYVDPIDGTRSFCKRNGQFAIHIGFCQENKPTLGVVYWPIAGEMYYGLNGLGAYRENARSITNLSKKLIERENGLIAMINDKESSKELEQVFQRTNVKEKHTSGSEGLRIMKIAEDIADFRIVDRIGFVSTWDICAPHAILAAAGGDVVYTDGTPLLYTGQGKLEKRYVAAKDKILLNEIVNVCRSENV